jgi:hypothetical protein
VVADFRARDTIVPFQVLRLQPDAREWENFVSPAQFRVPVNDNVRIQFATTPKHNVFADDAVGTDFAAGTNFRLRMNDGRGMNHGNFAM